MQPDAVVVGNGIVGAAVALRLAAAGLAVVSVEVAQPAGSATRASGAMLGVLGELVDHWRYDSEARWHERLSPLLGELAVMALGDDPAAAAKRQRAAALVRRQGRPELMPDTIIELLQTVAE